MAEFEDEYPVLDTSSAQPADDYPVLDTSSAKPADDYPVLDSSTIHASNVPRPPEDDYPILDQEPKNRGIVERTKEGFAGHYEPLLTDAVKKIAPSFAEQHPAITGVIQSALEKSPIGWADKAQAALFGAAPGAVAGAVAGAAEPLIGRSQADKLQSDTKTIIDMALIAPGLGWAGAATHGRGAQISDVGKTGFKQLNKQGQTAGADAAAGVAQEPRPPAAEPVADPQNKATLGTGEKEVGGENLNTRDYGKKTEPSAGGSGVNVGEVDPTLRQAIAPEPTVPLVRSNQVPTAEQATAAQERITARRQPPLAEVPAGTMELPPVEVKPERAPIEPVRPLNVAQTAIEEFRASPEALTERADPGAAPTSAGAAATPQAAVPIAPPTPRTRLVDTIRNAYDSLLDVGGKAINEVQMFTSPMAARSASGRARAIAKTQADAIRRVDYEWSVANDHIERRFNPEQRKRMWDAADEENVMRQRGEQSEHMGIATLEPAERALVDSFQPKARELWEQARDIGWVHGEGLPYYTPRMFEGIVNKVEGATALDAKGRNIQTTTPGMKTRKYMEAEESEAAAKSAFGEQAKIVRDIRSMPLALAKMEKALVNRTMIKKIEEVGRHAGEHTVIESTNKPGPGWFTIPDNPAFYTYRPRYEKADTAAYRGKVESHGVVKVPDTQIPLLDRNGNPVIDRVPIWIPGEFEGPLKSIMNKPAPLVERGLMALKGKTMSVIMNSPMIHNAVEWGRAFPTMPGKMLTLQTYFEGNAAKRGVPYNGTARYVRDWATGQLEKAPRNASPTMMEAIDHGLVPIGKRFFNQDITAVMEQPNLTPGRSLTAKTLALVPDLFSPKAGDAVKRGIDRAGDVWHNTLLWDRIGDLQMGLYVNAKRALVDKGLDPKMASYTAAHIANRYAGALPNEAMSGGARRLANFMMFSRTFTLGNLGVLKDMFNGFPRDVQAQMMRDLGTIDPKSTNYVRSLAKRKAMMAVGLDVGLMYIGNSVFQSVFNLMQDDNTLDKEAKGYVRRFNDAMERVKEHPLSLLNPITALGTVESLSATFENEPGKHDRIKVGETKEGRGIYMRNPFGKLGEEFVGYATGPLDMFKRKAGTIVRPAWQVLANDKGFGQKIYDPHTDMLSGKQIESAINIAKVMLTAQTPEGQLRAGYDLLAGNNAQTVGGVPVNALQALGPIGGFTFSQGHPGGPAAGEAFRLHEQEQFRQGPELREIRKLVQEGKTDEAIERMNKMEMAPGLRKSILNPQLKPRAIREMFQKGSSEQQGRFERALERRQQ